MKVIRLDIVRDQAWELADERIAEDGYMDTDSQYFEYWLDEFLKQLLEKAGMSKYEWVVTVGSTTCTRWDEYAFLYKNEASEFAHKMRKVGYIALLSKRDDT